MVDLFPTYSVVSHVSVSESVNDIVFDVTGFDMNVMTKEDLHKELRDECLSAPCFTPEAPPEEEVPKQTNILDISYSKYFLLIFSMCV